MYRSIHAIPLVAVLVGCGSGGATEGLPADGGGAIGDEGGAPTDSPSSGADGDASSAQADAGGSDAAVLTCAAPGNYKQNWSGSCGVERWPVKTGTDSAAFSVSLLPQLSTIAALTSLPQPSSPPAGARVPPAETTVYVLKDVELIFARLEDDSDYHLVISDGTLKMITEVPYPGCANGSAWSCEISRARASVDAQLNLVLDQGHNQTLTVSVVGVGFFDPEHGQYGVAPNNLELHPVLGICFGAGCDPTK